MSDFANWLRRAAANIEAPDPNVLFAEEPVSLSVFVQDRAYLGNPPLSPVQYDAVRHIERVYYPSLYPEMAAEFESEKSSGRLFVGPASKWREEKYWSEPIRMINFATLQWGKGSGKRPYLPSCLDAHRVPAHVPALPARLFCYA